MHQLYLDKGWSIREITSEQRTASAAVKKEQVVDTQIKPPSFDQEKETLFWEGF